MLKQKKLPHLIPSILSENIQDYQKFRKIFSNFSTKVHLDVMDGKFVPSRSPELIDILTLFSDDTAKLQLHLMVEKPHELLQNLDHLNKKLFQNVERVYLHVETVPRSIFLLKYSYEIGLVVSADTDIKKYRHLLIHSPFIQVMTVEPGHQGNPFIVEQLRMIDTLRELGFTGEIHVDGHVNEETLPSILEHWPDTITLGSVVTKSIVPELAFSKLEKQMIKHFQQL